MILRFLAAVDGSGAERGASNFDPNRLRLYARPNLPLYLRAASSSGAPGVTRSRGYLHVELVSLAMLSFREPLAKADGLGTGKKRFEVSFL